MNDLTLEITQEDINNGIFCNSVACPIALALLRRFNIPQQQKFAEDVDPGNTGVIVGITSCVIFTEEAITYYDLSEEAQDFISAFDALTRDGKRSDIKSVTIQLHIKKTQKKTKL